MYEIDFSNGQSLLKVDEALLCARLREALAAEGVIEADISVTLLDDAAIHAVNRNHLQHDYPTDVISFVYSAIIVPDAPGVRDNADGPASAFPSPPSPRGGGLCLDGEILVSTETALRQAQQYGWQAADELTLYLVHGLLHLCGYDDLTDEEQQTMRAREREVLSRWGLAPHYGE
jgi:probable rRNA maturation factor